MSTVAVGSFNSVGTPRSDGKIEINPAIHQLMQFGAKQENGTSRTTVVGVPLDCNR